MFVFGADIDRFVEIRVRQTPDSLDDVFDISKGARLTAITINRYGFIGKRGP